MLHAAIAARAGVLSIGVIKKPLKVVSLIPDFDDGRSEKLATVPPPSYSAGRLRALANW
jgi:hypothetical protein